MKRKKKKGPVYRMDIAQITVCACYIAASQVGLDKINYASIILGMIGGFLSTSLIGNNR